MKESFLDGRLELYGGDCLEVLPSLKENSVDSVCTDAPYHLTSIVKRFGAENAAPVKVSEFYQENGESKGSSPYKRSASGFMGKAWDGGDIAFRPETWAEVYRVLRPGGYLVAFCGTRTYHRMACAIEDAGFDIRDTIGWVYGSGFPKSHNQGNGWGTALKPAMELIVLARKPLSEKTVAANILKWGTGALNIDGCRVGTSKDVPASPRRAAQGPAYSDLGNDPGTGSGWDKNIGRWPANLILTPDDEVLAAFPNTKSGMLATHHSRCSKTANVYGSYKHNKQKQDFGGDSGSAARFFYSAKADSADRLGSKHPTVKPLDLMQYLVRLVTPKGGTVLDPFAGTGSTGEAAYLEGMKAVLIEREEEYLKDIRFRIQCFNMTKKERKHTASIRDKLTRNEVSKKEDG